MRNELTIIAVLCLVPTPALAGDPCRSAKDIVRMAQTFHAAEAELVDVVSPKVKMRLSGINGHPDPSHLMYRHAGETVRLPVVDGELQGLDQAADWSKDGEMCRLVDGELAPTIQGDATRADIGFDFPFIRTDGEFTIEEIMEGAKDGSKIMKGVAPGGLGFVVPKLKALQIFPAVEGGTTPIARFTRNGKAVTVPITRYADGQFIRLKDIKSAKADRLTITGAYRMDAGFKFDPDDYAAAEAKRVAKAQAGD